MSKKDIGKNELLKHINSLGFSEKDQTEHQFDENYLDQTLIAAINSGQEQFIEGLEQFLDTFVEDKNKQTEKLNKLNKFQRKIIHKICDRYHISRDYVEVKNEMGSVTLSKQSSSSKPEFTTFELYKQKIIESPDHFNQIDQNFNFGFKQNKMMNPQVLNPQIMLNTQMINQQMMNNQMMNQQVMNPQMMNPQMIQQQMMMQQIFLQQLNQNQMQNQQIFNQNQQTQPQIVQNINQKSQFQNKPQFKQEQNIKFVDNQEEFPSL